MIKNVTNKQKKMIKPEVYHLIMSGTRSQQLMGTEVIRRMLSIATNPPIQEVIDSGLLPKIIEFLEVTSMPQLQFEAAWVITNISSGNSAQTKTVVDAVPYLVKMVIESPSIEVKEQAIWALGNIAGDSVEMRDLVINAGLLPPLLK